MATIYLNNEKNLDNAKIKIEGVTKCSVGSKLVYVEYVENAQDRIRAFGRDEFLFLGINQSDTVEVEVNIVDLRYVGRLDLRFERPVIDYSPVDRDDDEE